MGCRLGERGRAREEGDGKRGKEVRQEYQEEEEERGGRGGREEAVVFRTSRVPSLISIGFAYIPTPCHLEVVEHPQMFKQLPPNWLLSPKLSLETRVNRVLKTD
jgi:hypothetical protein